jgi:large subunit ribosomal protein L4e
MFAPTKVFRKWHGRVNLKIRRIAVKAAISASAVPALIMARGHRIGKVPEIPLVVSNAIESLQKTKDAALLLKDIGVYRDVEKVKETKKIRPGKGKRRNRKYVLRKGPLLIVSKRCTAMRAFRNLPGVDIATTKSLNLLRLAPGGHIGRLIIWSENAFSNLDTVLRVKTLDHVPDSKRVINSEEVQSQARAKRPQKKRKIKRERPILNPASLLERKQEKQRHALRTKANKDRKARLLKTKAKKKAKKEWVARVIKKAKEEHEKKNEQAKKIHAIHKEKREKAFQKKGTKPNTKK